MLYNRTLRLFNMTGIFMTCGIYLLKFSKDKTYIGLSNNIEKRFKQHLLKLRKAQHVNYNVQKAYNALGCPILEIILDCLESELKEGEIEAFDIFKPTLNIALAGGAFPVGKGEDNPSSSYNNDVLISAILYVAENINEPLKTVSKTLGLHYSTLKNICNGSGHTWLAEVIPEEYTKVINNAGKRSINTAKSKGIIYPTVVSPDGIQYTIENATAFAKLHNLNQGTFGQLLRGKANHHHGWKIIK